MTSTDKAVVKSTKISVKDRVVEAYSKILQGRMLSHIIFYSSIHLFQSSYGR